MNISLSIIFGFIFSVNLFQRLSCLCKGIFVPLPAAGKQKAQYVVVPVETMHNFIHRLWKTFSFLLFQQKDLHTNLWISLFKCFW